MNIFKTKRVSRWLEEIVYKLKVYISKKHWICSDPEFIEKLDSYSNLAPEPESYSELLVALRHYSLLNPLDRDLFDKVVYCSVLYDLAQTTEYLDTLNETIEQASCRLRYLVNPSVEEESIPEYDEEEDYEDDEDSISSSSSYSSQSSPMEARVGDETWATWWEGWKASYSITTFEPHSSPPPLQAAWSAWWEGWKATHMTSDYYTPDSVSSPPPIQAAWSAWWEGWKATHITSDYYTPDSVSSPPPLQAAWSAWWEGWKATNITSDYYTPDSVSSPPPIQAAWSAWWEGWKRPSTSLHRDEIKAKTNPNPSHQVSIPDAWWEGWKESATTVFSLSSLIRLLLLLLLTYILSDSWLYSMPDVCDLSNPYDLPPLQHYLIPTGSMGGWVKAPGSYSSIPKAPPWQCPLNPSGSWRSTQDSTTSQRIQRFIFTNLLQSISTTYSPNQLHTPKVTEQARVFQDPVRIFNPG